MKFRAIVTAILFAIPTAVWADGPSLLVLGHSFHFGGNTNGLNGNNPGLGLEYSKGPWFAGGLTYYDSYRKQAYAGYLGYRYSVPLAGDWTAFASLRGGYIHGSGFNGPMVLPTVGLKYKHAAVEVMYIPKVNAKTVNVIGVFGRWEF
jgi:hypothetical protein